MVVIWGTTHAGKVDQVPGGMFHVVTRFGHLYYIPLIPTGSYLVLEEHSDGGFQGVEIPFSFKSLLAGWLRGFSIVAMIVAAFWGLIALLDAKQQGTLAWLPPLMIGLAAVAALVLSYKLKLFTEASYERAVELGRLVGFSDMGMLMIEIAYGRLSAAEAEARLAHLEQQAQPIEATIEPPPGYPPVAGPPAGYST